MRQQTPHDRAAWEEGGAITNNEERRTYVEAMQTHLNRGSCSLGSPVDSTTVTRVLVSLGHTGLGLGWGQHTSEFEEHRAAPHSHGGLLRSRQDSHRSAGRVPHRTHSHPHSICPSPPHLTSGTAHEQR